MIEVEFGNHSNAIIAEDVPLRQSALRIVLRWCMLEFLSSFVFRV